MTDLLIVAGARPNFMKVASVVEAITCSPPSPSDRTNPAASTANSATQRSTSSVVMSTRSNSPINVSARSTIASSRPDSRCDGSLSCSALIRGCPDFTVVVRIEPIPASHLGTDRRKLVTDGILRM